MNLFTKIILSTTVAVLLSTIYTGYTNNGAGIMPPGMDAAAAGGFALCAIIATIIGNLGARGSGAHDIYDAYAGDSQREEGEVKWFNVNKGFGFITRDEGGDIFVHYRSIRGEGRRSLKDGQRVEYEVVDSDKGLQAEDVCPV